MGWISDAWKVITNLPAIIALIKQLVDLIGGITGQVSVDETSSVNEVRRVTARLAECTGVACPADLVKNDR